MSNAWEVYREAEQYAEGVAREWLAEHPGVDPDTDGYDSLYDRAHETADGCAYVIFYWRSLAIFSASQEVRDYEDEAEAYYKDDSDILDRIALTVYAWMVTTIREKARDLYAEQENADEGGTGEA